MSEQSTRQYRDWPALISEWHGSGITKAAFCNRNGLSISRFYAMVKKMKESPSKKSFAKIEFANKTEPSPTSCIIELPNKTVLTLSNPSAELLRALIN